MKERNCMGLAHRIYETVDPWAGFVKEILGGFDSSTFKVVDLYGYFVYTALYVALRPFALFPLLQESMNYHLHNYWFRLGD